MSQKQRYDFQSHGTSYLATGPYPKFPFHLNIISGLGFPVFFMLVGLAGVLDELSGPLALVS